MTSEHTLYSNISMLKLQMPINAAKFYVEQMSSEDIYRLGKVPCAFMLYTYNPHNEELQTVHGIILWTGNPSDLPIIHGHSHFTEYPASLHELKETLRDLSNYHGSVVAQHGDMVNMKYESNSLRYIIDNLFINRIL